MYVFQFYHYLDLQRLFSGGPWSFNNHLLLLGRVNPGEVLSAIPLYHAAFWVQVHDLPARFMTQIVGEHLGNYIGEFMECDPNNNTGVWRTYMRIRV